jgi:hypothetical protein
LASPDALLEGDAVAAQALLEQPARCQRLVDDGVVYLRCKSLPMRNSPCSLTAIELTERAAAWHSLDAALVGHETSDDGALLQYRLDPEVMRSLIELLAAEGQCCPSVTFEATVSVRITAPAPLRTWVADAFAPVEGHHPPDDGKHS